MPDRRHFARRRVLAALAAGAASPALSQGFAGMGADADGFALPSAKPRFDFPKDHGAHPNYRIEWWYVTANLETATGALCGIQWTLFRTAMEPRETNGWRSPQIWFAHLGMTRAGEHRFAERFARGGIGQAGATPDPFEAWIDNWSMVSRAAPSQDAYSHLSLTADGGDYGYALDLQADGPLVFHGESGFSVKHHGGQASYYYSQPFYKVTGTLRWPDGPVQVTGRAWLDREWSSQPLGEEQTGWDWFSLHFDSGEKAMVFRVRDRDGGGFFSGTWIFPDGRTEVIKDGEVTLAERDFTDINGQPVPTAWDIAVPSRGLSITTEPLYPRAWMGTNVSYWEGPIRMAGSHPGVGYLEMTGYA
ncbi:MAG: lipocalin-like domain-containing protein [Pseudomonadota bacterium]